MAPPVKELVHHWAKLWSTDGKATTSLSFCTDNQHTLPGSHVRPLKNTHFPRTAQSRRASASTAQSQRASASTVQQPLASI